MAAKRFLIASFLSLASVLVPEKVPAQTQEAGPPTACSAPTLPVTGTRIVNVSTEQQLQTAMSNLQSGDTIILANGTYNLSRTLYVNGKHNVTIRGASGCDNVVLIGKGMNNASYGSVPNGVWSNSQNTTLAHLTIRDTYENLVLFNAGAQAPHVYSVKLLDSGSQFIKSNPTDAANAVGVDNGVIEYSWIEYTAGTPTHAGNVGYTNGISAHSSDNWVIRGNLFRNIHNPDDSPYPWNPAVLMWNRSSNTTTEGNVFVNVDRAIAYGLTDRSSSGTHDHSGGIIRNNFIYLAPGFFSAGRKAASDATIVVWDSPSSDVHHNTILTNGNVARSIEFRFTTTGAEARNNLSDLPIGTRDGGTVLTSNNYLGAIPGMFVNPSAGNLHLLQNTATLANVIDKAPLLSTVNEDIDGDIRPVGSATDIGADEVTTSVTPVVTPSPASTPSPTPSPTASPSPTSSPTPSPSPSPSPTSSPSPGPTADKTAPSVAITSPQPGSVVRGTVAVNVTALDNVAVAKVEIRANGALIASDATSPYGISWNTRPYRNNTRVVLRATAFDAAGNSSYAEISVIVRRGGG